MSLSLTESEMECIKREPTFSVHFLLLKVLKAYYESEARCKELEARVLNLQRATEVLSGGPRG